jgi:Ethanolamine utilization protein EutJ (predicted chaperonin)
MNIDLTREYKDLDQNVKEQINSAYNVAKGFKTRYLKKEAEELTRLEKEPSEEDLIDLPAVGKMAEGVDQKIQEHYKKETQISGGESIYKPNLINYFYKGIVKDPTERKNITYLRKIMKN